MLGGLAVLSFLVAFLAIRVLLSRFGRFALDRPNERSLHDRPVPRTGGIAVLLGAAVSFAFGAVGAWLPALVAFGLAIASFIDDLRGMPTALKLLLHLIASTVLCWYLLSPMNPVKLVLLIVAVAWITNLYNFMDGSDGLAGGMSAIGFGAYAVAAYVSGHEGLAALCTAIAAASVAFLAFNLHPARIFLGDAGSIPLGFLAGGLGMLGWRDDLWPLWFPLLVFGPFIGDATLTLLKRLIRGEHVWRAHRDHYYQRMVRMGLGHRTTAWIAYAVMAACAGAALLGRSAPPAFQAAAFGAASSLLVALAVWVDIRWGRFLRGADKPA